MKKGSTVQEAFRHPWIDAGRRPRIALAQLQDQVSLHIMRKMEAHEQVRCFKVNKKAILVSLVRFSPFQPTNKQESSKLYFKKSKPYLECFSKWQANQDRQAKALILLQEKVLLERLDGSKWAGFHGTTKICDL